MIEYRGQLQGQGIKVAIVVARFNETITRSLLEGAIDGLTRLGCGDADITTAWVPGSFEIPVVAKALAESGKYDAIICLGAIIRGSTPHFDYIAAQTASGIAQVAQSSSIPVIFGVLTTESIEQALERSGTKSGNRGFDAAMQAVEMANLMKALRKKR